MSFIDNLLNKIGHFFAGIFDKAQHAWNHLEPEVQQALLHGSGVIALINQNIDKAPKELIDLLQQKFPDLSIEKLQTGLNQIDKAFGIAGEIDNPDLETLLTNLQKYIQSLGTDFWEGISSTMAQLLSLVFAPASTPFAKISMLIEFVYQKLIKK